MARTGALLLAAALVLLLAATPEGGRPLAFRGWRGGRGSCPSFPDTGPGHYILGLPQGCRGECPRWVEGCLRRLGCTGIYSLVVGVIYLVFAHCPLRGDGAPLDTLSAVPGVGHVTHDSYSPID